MATTEHLAEFVVETQFPEIPANAASQVKKSILDGIGTSLESTVRPIGRIVAELTEELGGNPVARVIGSGIQTSAPSAAFANGILCHGADYDDIGPGFGHTASVLMPTVLGLGEQLHLSGKQAMEAFVVGFEVGARIGSNIGADHYAHGWHSTATNGAMGAAAAASRMLGLDVEQTRCALGLAASSAAGIRANFGYMAKPFHPGNSARAGIIAAMLAQKGMTANLDAVEGRFGYFDVYGNGQADLAGVSQNLGESFAIADGIQIKPWPTCGGNHVAISLLEEMWAEHGVRADDIASVEVTISQNPADIAPNIADPKTGFQGKFSLWYNIAAWILDGQINLNSFTDRRARRPQLRDLMNRVSVTQHEDYKAMPTGTTRDARFNEIAIHMKDGTVLSHRMEAARRLEGEEVLDKYRDNARLAGMGRAQIDRAIQLVQALEEVEDVNSLVDCTVAQVNAGID